MLRDAVKQAAFGVYASTLAPVQSCCLSLAGGQRVSVLCYHRVSDDLKDNLTLPVESFDRQMVFLRRTYPIATVADLVNGAIDRTAGRPIVLVTFDDGYLDNYTNAYPILRKHGIPATFFVSTGVIGTQKGFAHDLDVLGRPLPTMTWDQLREMHAQGFEIGSHTVNHVNLAKASDTQAREELTGALVQLRQEIGVQDVAFGYCFGGRNDITAERRELVKSLGYTCCFSAFGGTNVGNIDLFDIKRFGVNWGFTEAALRAYIEGWS